MPSNRTIAALRATTIGWASRLTTIAREFAPIHLKEHIHSSVKELGEGTFVISVGVNLDELPLQKYGTLDAKAQEYGQPSHPIDPVNKKYLSFYWEKMGSWVNLPHVNHPGHAPYKGLGYLRPAITEVLAESRGKLVGELRDAIMGDIHDSFKGGG